MHSFIVENGQYIMDKSLPNKTNKQNKPETETKYIQNRKNHSYILDALCRVDMLNYLTYKFY